MCDIIVAKMSSLLSLSLFLSPEGKEEREICSTNVALVPFEIVKKRLTLFPSLSLSHPTTTLPF